MSTFSCGTGGAFVYGSYIKAACCVHKKSGAMNLRVLLNHKKGQFTCLIDKKSLQTEKNKESKIWNRWRVKIKEAVPL